MKKKSIFKYKTYAHFDERKCVDSIKEYIYNPTKIKEHSFYPFILDIHKMNKFDVEKYKLRKKGEYSENLLKPKSRNIMFSSHIDRYIYQLYNYKLNIRYNKFAKTYGIDKCSIAYRNNLHGKNNISFAHEVFKFILNTNNCYIMIGDFKDFFENIQHKYLKRMLCKIFYASRLEEDYYAVFKNITSYSYFDLKDICKIKNITKKDLYKREKITDKITGKTKEVFKMNKIMNANEIGIYKKYLKHNKEMGIPQGSSISSVLANIYMIDADKKINDLVTSNKGIYRRYSDDFIVVIPCESSEKFKYVFKSIKEILKKNGNPQLEDKKTKVFFYKENTIKNVNTEFLKNTLNRKNEIDFLGFSFDGKKIKIRDKSLSKFYYRMYGKIKTIAKCHGITKKGKRISNKELYRLYSEYGKKIGHGNFITYNERCEKKFNEGLEENFVSYKKRFWKKMKNRYNKEMKNYM